MSKSPIGVRDNRFASLTSVVVTMTLAIVLSLAGCAKTSGAASEVASRTDETVAVATEEAAFTYAYDEVPLERAGIALHLDRVQVEGSSPERNILLVHGVTYSSHEFDIDYEDYSLVRFLARQGYAVWRLDIAGFGQSQAVKDGFMPDSAYASEDVNAAVERIVTESGQERIDVLGWSWGTVTTSLYAKSHPEHLGKLVLYAPILSGLGEVDVTEPFHENTWEHAASDFQMSSDGVFDDDITEPVVRELFCSSCWHYDETRSPNGGRRDLCVSEDIKLIDLTSIPVPTLVIHGDNDPYLNYDLTDSVLEQLPEGSQHVVIQGGAHTVLYEKPYYHEFQNAIASFLVGE